MIRILTVYYLIDGGINQIASTKGHLESTDDYRRILPLIQWIFWIVLATMLIISYIKKNEYKYQLAMGHIL